MFPVQGLLWHAPPDVVRSSVLPKGNDGTPRLTSFDRVCCTKAVMSCHARRCRPCVLSKGSDVMPRPKSSDRALSPMAVISCHARRRHVVFCPMAVMSCHDRPRCSPRAMISFHAPHRPTVGAVQGRRWHATPEVIRPCVLSKGGDGMPHPMSSDFLCCPKAMIACHTRRRLTVCAVPRR